MYEAIDYSALPFVRYAVAVLACALDRKGYIVTETLFASEVLLTVAKKDAPENQSAFHIAVQNHLTRDDGAAMQNEHVRNGRRINPFTGKPIYPVGVLGSVQELFLPRALIHELDHLGLFTSFKPFYF